MRALVAASFALTFAFAALADDAPKKDAPPKKDDRATKDDYALDTSKTSSKVAVGADGTFSIVVTPKNGKKVHPEAPLEVTLKEPEGLKLKKTKLGRADVKDKQAAAPEVTTTMTGKKPGSYTLEVSVSFFLCTDAWCQRMSDKLSVPVTVE